MAPHRLLISHHRHSFRGSTIVLSSLPCTLAVVAGVAEGLQVSELQRRTAPVDRNDVIDHLRRRVPVVFQTLLA